MATITQLDNYRSVEKLTAQESSHQSIQVENKKKSDKRPVKFDLGLYRDATYKLEPSPRIGEGADELLSSYRLDGKTNEVPQRSVLEEQAQKGPEVKSRKKANQPKGPGIKDYLNPHDNMKIIPNKSPNSQNESKEIPSLHTPKTQEPAGNKDLESFANESNE